MRRSVASRGVGWLLHDYHGYSLCSHLTVLQYTCIMILGTRYALYGIFGVSLVLLVTTLLFVLVLLDVSWLVEVVYIRDTHCCTAWSVCILILGTRYALLRLNVR